MSSIFQTPELAIGIAVGGAAGAAFEPKIETPKQKAWAANRVLIPDIGVIAALLAGGKITPKDADNFAARLGFDAGTLDSLTWLAQNRLDFAVMLRLWRRFGAFDAVDDAALEALMDETLAHEQLDWDYEPWLKRLKLAELPGIGDIAYGIVRGILPAPSWVPVAPPTTTTNVKRFPVVDIDPVKLAAALGFDEEMLKLLVGRSGLSMAPGLAAQAHFRKILEADDYLLAVAEGDLRTEWGAALLEVSRQILNPHEYAEAELRGVKTHAEAKDGAAQHGMIEGDYDTLFAIMGRPLAEHQVTTGLARGGTYGGTYGDVPEGPFRDAIRRSAIRPEYASLAYANRYTYPTGFQIRHEAPTDGYEFVHGLLLKIGWEPELAKHYATKWSESGTTAIADPHVKSEQGRLRTAAHNSYVKGESGTSDVTAALEASGVDAAAVPAVLAVWDAERALIRKQLSVAQIKKAVSDAVVNAATGLAWTVADAIAALVDRGYSPADAQTIMAEA